MSSWDFFYAPSAFHVRWSSPLVKLSIKQDVGFLLFEELYCRQTQSPGGQTWTDVQEIQAHWRGAVRNMIQTKDGTLVLEVRLANSKSWFVNFVRNRGPTALLYVYFDSQYQGQSMKRSFAWLCAGLCAAAVVHSAAAQQSPFESRTYMRDGLKITVGQSRMIMRGPMFPWAMLFDDGSIVVTAQAVEESGPATYVRSTDRGQTWRPFLPPPDYGIPNVQFPDGTAINAASTRSPIPDRPGYYQTRRFESKDRGLSTTLTKGTIYLPPDVCSPKKPHMFQGNTILTSRGDLLAVMQGMEEPIPEWPEGGKSPFKCYLVKSTDQGHTWRYVSHIASLRDLSGSTAAAALRTGWLTWGPCEGNLVEIGDQRLVCVMRTLNDDLKPLIGAASDTYRDLFSTVRGADIYPGSLTVPDDKFYPLSPPTTPILICYSDDGGEHWTPPAAMREARGCMPQPAYDGQILALSAGALHYPRWGNGITFSLDGGHTWTELINYAPFFTSGYGGLLAIGRGHFLAIYDYAAPQPWKDHTGHWVGVVDITVERE